MTKTGEAIREARKKRSITQEELAEKLGVSPQAVSKWENGHNLPDIENMMQMAEILNVPYGSLLCADSEQMEIPAFRDRLFREENMYTRMRSFAQSESLPNTYRALQYMREKHAGQFRKRGRYSAEEVQYINHPLMMACHAHALGLRDDALLSAILLHDVVEDTGVSLKELPFDEEIRAIVGLVSFSVPEGMGKSAAKKAYYERIRENGKACLVKIIDRCSNVSTMAGSFSRPKLIEYITETEEYILPLADVLKEQYAQYSDAAFVVKYQILALLETIKYLLAK